MKFTKEDLENGMRVKNEHGFYYIVSMPHLVANDGGKLNLDKYHEDLTTRDGTSDDFKIIKVYGKYNNCMSNDFGRSGTPIWEREVDIEELTMAQVCKELGREVKIKK